MSLPAVLTPVGEKFWNEAKSLVRVTRIEHPEATLSELAELSHPALTRATIAGRLRRIVERADQIA